MMDYDWRATSLTLHHVRIPLHFTFAHAKAHHRAAESLILEMTFKRRRDGAEFTGFSQILPRTYLTGETITGCVKSLEERWWPLLKNVTFADDEDPFQALQCVYLEADKAGELAAYSGLDIAVFDAWGKLKGKNLASHWLKEPARRNALSHVVAPIPFNGPILLWLLAWRAKGIREIKLKVGPFESAKRLETFERWSAKDARFCLDANGSLTLEQAQNLLAGLKLRQRRPFLFEEPLTPKSCEDLALLSQSMGIPLMADESLCTLADAQALLDHHSVQIFNLRLAKNGGFSGLMAHAAMAKSAGLCLRLGVLVGESQVLAAAAAAAVGLADFDACEYGFAGALLRGDPFSLGPTLSRGTVAPNINGLGLGVSLNKKALKRATIRCVTL